MRAPLNRLRPENPPSPVAAPRVATATSIQSRPTSTKTGQTDFLPEEAVLASLGCGNPTALASLEPGEVVLDLGSGGGIDVLVSARRVGPHREGVRA